MWQVKRSAPTAPLEWRRADRTSPCRSPSRPAYRSRWIFPCLASRPSLDPPPGLVAACLGCGLSRKVLVFITASEYHLLDSPLQSAAESVLCSPDELKKLLLRCRLWAPTFFSTRLSCIRFLKRPNRVEIWCIDRVIRDD